MKKFALFMGFLMVLSTSVLAENTTSNETNATLGPPPLPCGPKGCIVLFGFVADFQPIGGIRLIKLNDVTIRIEPYSASTLNESGYFVQYKLPYWYSNNDSFVALPINIAQGLDQTNFNNISSENTKLKSDLFWTQIAALIMFLIFAGSIGYNWYQEYSDES